MANEYASLDTIKQSMNVHDDDETRDGLLTRALAAASRSIDRTCGRRFWLDPEPVQRRFNPHGRVVCEDEGEVLLVDDIGSATGLIVETGSGSNWTAMTNYEPGPDNALLDGRPITSLLRPGGIWHLQAIGARVRITARFGWPRVPEEVEQATLIQATRLFKRKDSPEGVTGSAEWGVVRLSRRDPDVYGLIENLILPGFG